LDAAHSGRLEVRSREEEIRMQRLSSRVSAVFALSTFLAATLALSGCDSGNGTSTAPMDEATKKVDTGVQGGMKDFMQSKQQPKAKAK
jgi:hypothetical protein